MFVTLEFRCRWKDAIIPGTSWEAHHWACPQQDASCGCLFLQRHRRDHAYVELVSNRLQQLEGFSLLPKRKVILSLDSFHATGEDPSPLCYNSHRWHCISHPGAKSFPSPPAVSLQVSAFPSINLGRKGVFCAGVWELHIQFPPVTAAGLWFLGQLHDLTMVLSPAVKWEETYFFRLLSLTTTISLYLFFICLQFKTESRIISKAPPGCLGSPTSLG